MRPSIRRQPAGGAVAIAESAPPARKPRAGSGYTSRSLPIHTTIRVRRSGANHPSTHCRRGLTGAIVLLRFGSCDPGANHRSTRCRRRLTSQWRDSSASPLRILRSGADRRSTHCSSTLPARTGLRRRSRGCCRWVEMIGPLPGRARSVPGPDPTQSIILPLPPFPARLPRHARSPA